MQSVHTVGKESIKPLTQNDTAASDYRQFMIRELLIWVVGVPVPVAAIIGLFVL
ncbi:hypothetical protein QO002_002378 [Pararhizobium capsulatum DSM 1112]|uniref:Uncharacterized protein n=1 Tax=Pararhizobium capsulatum DSM 1112 TaxID=1121113 RepID=A0ABU0BRW8_9HYPH|nr:hypothetical protein [Pararhizobium capsulatum]MDQ0320240.1 hypothetical protein [Pararhizobium capsulatum DSM 1112]